MFDILKRKPTRSQLIEFSKLIIDEYVKIRDENKSLKEEITLLKRDKLNLENLLLRKECKRKHKNRRK